MRRGRDGGFILDTCIDPRQCRFVMSGIWIKFEDPKPWIIHVFIREYGSEEGVTRDLLILIYSIRRFDFRGPSWIYGHKHSALTH